MAKLARVNVEGETGPFFELVATSQNDISAYPHWLFKAPTFRYVFTPSPEGLAGRWMAEMDQAIGLYTRHPRWKDIVAFIRGRARLLVPLEAGGLENIRPLAIRELKALEAALASEQPMVSVTVFPNIVNAIIMRAAETLGRKLMRQGIYRDADELLADAAYHGIEVVAGELTPRDIYIDEQDVKFRVFEWIRYALQRKKFLARGDPLPPADTIGRWLATDINKMNRAFNQDVTLGLPYWQFMEEFHAYIMEQYGPVGWDAPVVVG